MVAALLFHKYRFIGLLSVSKQWGREVAGNSKATFPVTVNSVFAIVVGALGGGWGWIGDITNSGFTNKNGQKSCYIMVGKV